MNLVVKIILLLLGGLAVMALGLWGYGKYWFATKQSDRKIAGGLSIGSDWVEILPRPPLRIQKHVQYLILIIDGYYRKTISDPEVEIVDELGNVQRLESHLLSSNLAYRSHFRKDQVITRVRIRCQTPFQCSRVIWECERLK